MARYHLRYRNIHARTRKAAQTLFDSKPWQGTDEEKQSKYERFLRDASTVYGVPTPTLAIIPEAEVIGYVAPHTIILNKFSVTTMLHTFRLHMQYMGVCSTPFADFVDAQSWACSLFYTIRPILFRKRVREGRINGVTPDDLLTSATLASRQEEVDEAFAGIVAESYATEDIEDEDGNGDDYNEAPTYLTVAEAAEVLGVSTSTVRNMLRDGRLTAHPTVINGRERVLVTEDSLSRQMVADA